MSFSGPSFHLRNASSCDADEAREEFENCFKHVATVGDITFKLTTKKKLRSRLHRLWFSVE